MTLTSSAACVGLWLAGRMLKRWRRRWFVLQDSTLYSFKKERVYDEPTEIIDLRVFSSVKSSEDYTHRAHSFDVYSTDMVFSMVAPSESDKEGRHTDSTAQPQRHVPRLTHAADGVGLETDSVTCRCCACHCVL